MAKNTSYRELQVEQYNELELEAMETMPNRIIESAFPVTFGSLGYPIRAETTRSLGRFVDVMHETRSLGTFQQYLKGITAHEFELLKKVTRATLENSEQKYGEARIATSSLLRALVMFRSLKAIYPEKGRLIFEIGHGSGYLGAFLVADGYGYASTDVTQAFYVYQNQLLNTLIPGKVKDLAIDGEFGSIDEVESGTALHIPWWKFYAASPQTKLAVDAVTCNHALAEMSFTARSYVIRFSRMMLQNTDSAFVFEGWGSTVHTPISAVTKRFFELDYVIAHNDIFASVFVPNDGSATKGHLQLPPPQINKVTSQAEALTEDDILQQYHPPIYESPDSILSKRLKENLTKTSQRITVDYDQIMEFFKKELKREDVLSDDEKYWDFVYPKLDTNICSGSDTELTDSSLSFTEKVKNVMKFKKKQNR